MGVAMICCAALLVFVALNLFATALVGVLTANGVPFWLSATIIGGAFILVALLLALVGKSRLSTDALAPSRSLESIKRDIQTLKETGHVGD